MFFGALRLLFAMYVMALCALAISDPSFERGGALLLLTLGIIGVMWELDLGIAPVNRKHDTYADAELIFLSGTVICNNASQSAEDSIAPDAGERGEHSC
jgi:hypothetical protein